MRKAPKRQRAQLSRFPGQVCGLVFDLLINFVKNLSRRDGMIVARQFIAWNAVKERPVP